MRVGILLLALMATACSTAAAPDPSQTSFDGMGDGTVVVMAAASLSPPFTVLGDMVEAADPDLTVVFGLAGSQTIATQVIQGNPADLVVTADTVQMDRIAAEGLLAGAPTTVATNTLAIAVEAGNPHGVRGLADLADPDLVVVLAAPDVPAGRLAAEVLDRAGVRVTPASLELNVRAALTKVELGEADAAIVYTSDITTAADTVEGVAIPGADNATTTYPAALVATAANPAGAQAFLDLLRSPEGQAVMAEHGFGPP